MSQTNKEYKLSANDLLQLLINYFMKEFLQTEAGVQLKGHLGQIFINKI